MLQSTPSSLCRSDLKLDDPEHKPKDDKHYPLALHPILNIDNQTPHPPFLLPPFLPPQPRLVLIRSETMDDLDNHLQPDQNTRLFDPLVRAYDGRVLFGRV